MHFRLRSVKLRYGKQDSGVKHIVLKSKAGPSLTLPLFIKNKC